MSKKGQPRTTHGMFGTKFYTVWKNMKARCRRKDVDDPNRRCYNGVTFCKRWLKFANFKADMYESYLQHVSEHGESKTSIDRIDSSKGYSSKNCRWATPRQQTNNRKNVRLITYKDKTLNLKQWADELGMYRSVLHSRLKKGWPLSRVLTNERFNRDK